MRNASIRRAGAIIDVCVLRRRSGKGGIVSLRELRRPSCLDRISRRQRQASQSETGDEPLQWSSLVQKHATYL